VAPRSLVHVAVVPAPPRSLLRTAALTAATVLAGLGAAVLATPLDAWSRGLAFGVAPFAAGIAAGGLALRVGVRRSALVAATSAALCFAAMLVAFVAATLR
jgi:peptidoglycan/LPS O-acetylase OafA/YrhL